MAEDCRGEAAVLCQGISAAGNDQGFSAHLVAVARVLLTAPLLERCLNRISRDDVSLPAFVDLIVVVVVMFSSSSTIR